MLDTTLKSQLRDVFKVLEGQIELIYDQSNHATQHELEALLHDVAETSKNIKAIASGTTGDHPRMVLGYNGHKTRIAMEGVPGGHEFSSLVLAILHADGKGKMPDAGLIKRIKSLQGPVNVRTVISLSCENCPDVVQALNLMALQHPEFSHTMVDGSLIEQELSQLAIQGVPAVLSGQKLISSGKTTLASLLSKLEEFFGKQTSPSSQHPSQSTDLGKFDVAILGGGPAGVAAAIYAARKGQKTALIAERIGGQVKDTVGIENLISVPYIEGPQLAASLDKHLASNDVTVLEHRRILSITDGPSKVIRLDSGEFLNAPSVIITLGAKWRTLGVPGESDYLGKGVAYCPHCDGPYYKGKDVAVIGGGNSGVEAAIDLAGIVKSVVVLEFAPELRADKILKERLLALPNASIITNAQTMEVKGDGQKLVALHYRNRVEGNTVELPLDGVFVQIGLIPSSELVKDLVATNKAGEIIVDSHGRTNIKGVYAAGDVTTTPYKQIIIAMGEGAKAALAAYEDTVLRPS